MAHLTTAQKHARFASFFVALSLPHIAEPMQSVGFTPAHWDRVSELLRRSIEARRALRCPPIDRLPALVELERRWMPIVRTTLELNHPALHRELLGNYQRVSGPVLVPLLQEVLARIEGLGRSPDLERQKARALLAERGITAAVIAGFETAIRDALTVETMDADPDAEERVAEADEAMWSFYLEWSRMARSVITDHLALRQLGFLRPAKRSEARDAAEPEEERPRRRIVLALPERSTVTEEAGSYCSE